MHLCIQSISFSLSPKKKVYKSQFSKASRTGADICIGLGYCVNFENHSTDGGILNYRYTQKVYYVSCRRPPVNRMSLRVKVCSVCKTFRMIKFSKVFNRYRSKNKLSIRPCSVVEISKPNYIYDDIVHCMYTLT